MDNAHVNAVYSLSRPFTHAENFGIEPSAFEHLVIPWMASSRAPEHHTARGERSVQLSDFLVHFPSTRSKPVTDGIIEPRVSEIYEQELRLR